MKILINKQLKSSFLPFFSLIFFSNPFVANSQTESQSKVLKEFTKNAFFSTNVHSDSLNKHIKFHKKLIGKPQVESHLVYMIELAKKRIDFPFEDIIFLNYEEVNNSKIFKNQSLFKDLAHKNNNQVFYFTVENSDKLYGPILMKGDKVISFLPIANFGGDGKVYPLMLNKKIALDYILEVNKYLGI